MFLSSPIEINRKVLCDSRAKYEQNKLLKYDAAENDFARDHSDNRSNFSLSLLHVFREG